MSTAPLQLLAETDGDATWLLAPAVGLFTEALPTGALAAPGARAGTLLRLGRPHPVVMPPDLGGAILEACAERVHQPVGHGTRLYRLGPLDEAGASAASSRHTSSLSRGSSPVHRFSAISAPRARSSHPSRRYASATERRRVFAASASFTRR